MKPIRQELLAENAELKRRLEEAEETLEALRTGAVDALVVSSPEGEQVFTLKGADHTYRHLVENINEGAATLTTAGDILYANGRLAEILGLPLEQLIGSALREHIDEMDLIYFDALFALARKGESKGEVLLRPENGSSVPTYLSFNILNIEDTPAAMSLVVTDLKEQKRHEAVIAEGQLTQEILSQAEQAIAVCDRSERIIRASRGLHQLCSQNPLLLPFQLAFPLRLKTNQPFLPTPLFQGKTLHNVEASFQQPGGRLVHVLVNAGPLLTEGAEIKGCVVAFTDITDRIEAEAEKQKLLEELLQREEELQALNEELQVLNEELLSQADELRRQTGRLHAKNDELQVLTKTLHVQTDELETANREILMAHKALQESREDLNRAQAVAHTGSWRLDVRQNKLTWSDEAHRIFGIPQGTPLSYETFLAAVHPEDREYVDQNWLSALKGEPYDIEHRIVVEDTVKWVRERAELEFDTRGWLLGGFGTTQDITERKQAEEALRESGERLRQAAQAGRMFAFEWDPETDAVKRSPEAGLILGLSADAAIHDNGQDFFGKIYPADRAPFIQKHHDLNPGADRYIADYRIIRADNGQVVWLEEIAHALFDAQGKMLRLYGMTMDVTERKEAEAALQTAHIRAINEKNRLEAVMEALPVGVSIVDERGGVIQCNDMFDKLWGGPRPTAHEVSDYGAYKAWWLDTGKQVQPEEWASAQAVQQGKTVIGQLVEIERFDGERRYVINSGAPVRDAAGKIIGCAVAIFDLTAQKRAEEALRLSHQRLDLLAESANRLLASEAPQEVVDTICPKVMEFLDCDVFFNFLRDEQEERLHLNAWAGISAEEAQRIEWLDYGVAVCGCAARDGCRIVAEDIQTTADARTELVKSYGIQAYACQPLMSQGRVLGTLSFGTRRRSRFTKDELALMQAVADQVAVAVERKLFVQALWNSRERERLRVMEMEAILEAVPVPIFLSRDSSGRSITGNPTAYKLLQLPPGCNLSMAAPAGERPQYKASQDGRELRRQELPMQRALAGQRVHDLEYDLILRDGRIRHISANAVPLLDLAGRPQGAVGVFMDLTERKQTHEALRRAHDELEDQVRKRTKDLQFTVTQLQEEVLERQRAEAELTKQTKLVYDLYNEAPCGYHSLDPEGKFVQINDTELIWLGYSREEVVGRMSFADLLTAESLQRFRQNFPGFMERGEVYDLEYQMIRKDGTVFPVLLSATAVRDEAGNFLMSRGTIFDLTARVQAEAALASERQRLFQVLEQLPAYVLLLAPDYTVSYANREFIQRFGMAAKGQRCYEFLFGRDNPCEHCQTFRVLETNDRQEWEWLGPDGRTYAVFDYPFFDVDESPLILELGLDITARKRAEAALSESEEKLRYLSAQLLTAQENERKRLASELHDELGHALLTMKLHLRLMEKQLDPAQLSLGDEMESMVEYLDKVINDVRRLYNALSPGDLEDLGLTTALSNMLDELIGLHDTIDWSVHLDNIDDLYTLQTQTVIYRIIQEILTNIGKHANASRVSVIIKRENQGASFTVEDDGQGFDMEKVLATTAAKRGLGLPAMEERVRILGGSLTIWSQESQGTRIAFTIPVSKGGT